jgi:Raf kinase inhibitor-like YbhB/YbcL family protein
LTSTAFQPNQPIPARCTCDGEDRSPALSWDGAPDTTEAFALVVDDPDAPQRVFTHWVLFDLPAAVCELREHLPTTGRPAQGGVQGRNDFGSIGYRGPCPPVGAPHRYRFTLYALDRPVRLDPGASKRELLQAIEGRIVSQAQLVGTYRRQP